MSAVRLQGVLISAAHRITVDGQAFVYLTFSPPAATPQLVGNRRRCVATARRAYGTGAGAQIAAKCAALELGRGQRIEVHAAGWAVDEHSRELVLVGVDHIEQLDRPPAYWQDARPCLENLS